MSTFYNLNTNSFTEITYLEVSITQFLQLSNKIKLRSNNRMYTVYTVSCCFKYVKRHQRKGNFYFAPMRRSVWRVSEVFIQGLPTFHTHFITFILILFKKKSISVSYYFISKRTFNNSCTVSVDRNEYARFRLQLKSWAYKHILVYKAILACYSALMSVKRTTTG